MIIRPSWWRVLLKAVLAKKFIVLSLLVFGYLSYGFFPGVPQRKLNFDMSVVSFSDYFPRDTVVVYSMNKCPVCDYRKKELIKAGISFDEKVVDNNPYYREQLEYKLTNAGIKPGSVRIPIVEVNGTLLTNNPTIYRIKQHLKPS